MGDIVVIVIVLNFVFHFHFFFYVIFQLPYVGSVESFADCLDKVRKSFMSLLQPSPLLYMYILVCQQREERERERRKALYYEAIMKPVKVLLILDKVNIVSLIWLTADVTYICRI